MEGRSEDSREYSVETVDAQRQPRAITRKCPGKSRFACTSSFSSGLVNQASVEISWERKLSASKSDAEASVTVFSLMVSTGSLFGL